MTKEKVIEILANYLEIDPSEITDETTFEDLDLGLGGSEEVDVQHMQISIGATYWFL